MTDTLTTGDRRKDQQRYLRTRPELGAALDLVQELISRQFSPEGQALSVRLLRAVLGATCDFLPLDAAPRSQLTVYGEIRSVLYDTLFGLIAGSTAGTDGPLLSNFASDALARIETQDPTVSVPTTRIADLALVLKGVTWLVVV